MSKKALLNVIGRTLELLPVILFFITVYYLIDTFILVGNPAVTDKSVLMKQGISNAMQKSLLAPLFGFLSFLYPFFMLTVHEFELANKFRRSFFITGIFSLWGGLIPLFLMIFMKHNFAVKKTDNEELNR